MTSIYLVLVHPQEFSVRAQKLQSTIQLIQQATRRLQIPLTIRQVPLLKNPHQIFRELKPRIAPKPTGFEPVDDWIDETHRNLDAHRVSHWVHHEVALRSCFEDKNIPTPKEQDIIWVLEDDTLFADKSVESLTKMLTAAIANKSWKILFTGACQVQPTEDALGLVDSTMIPMTHESVMFRASRAKDIFPEMETIRCAYQGFMWYLSHKYPDEVYGLSKACTVDGSKIGIFPSSLSSTAPPVLNHDYRQLKELVESPEPDKAQIKILVNKLKRIQCTNGLFPYVTYLAKSGKKDEALELAEEIFQWKAMQQGLMDPACPILTWILEQYREQNNQEVKKMREDTTLVSKISHLSVA